MEHYHRERKHHGLGIQLIVPLPARAISDVRVLPRERLGGLLKYYHRPAARQRTVSHTGIIRLAIGIRPLQPISGCGIPRRCDSWIPGHRWRMAPSEGGGSRRELAESCRSWPPRDGRAADRLIGHYASLPHATAVSSVTAVTESRHRCRAQFGGHRLLPAQSSVDLS
jgi:hypothetical protein